MHSEDEDTRPRTGTERSPAAAAGADTTGDEAAKNQLWAFAQQSLEHCILCIDTRQQVTWASPGATEILGEPAETIVGQSAARFFTAEDLDMGIPLHEVAVAISRGSAEDDRWMLRADGSRFWASGMMTAIRDAEGAVTGFVKLFRNLTAMRMQLDTLHNRGEALAAADEAKRRWIATLAHELRNPLSAAAMAASNLRQMTRDESGLHRPIDVIERNIEFAARLIADLEDASSAAQGKLSLKLESLMLNELLQASKQVALSRAGGDAPDIDLLLPPAPLTLEGDHLRLQQVFVNLIGNAIKFTPASGRVWVKATIEGDEAVVRVEDDGMGIAADKLESIFEMFTQSSDPGTSVGLGIGLAVVKQIVALHGGTVQARSDGIGKGSNFTVRLPLRQPKTPRPKG